jgi:hypothetical protein
MGWIIRFIHNRDKATQNIAYQCSRASMLGMIPSDVLQGICDRYRRSNTQINERSVLMDAETVMTAKQTAGAGMFMVSIHQSRRNTKENVKARGKLRQQIRRHLEQSGEHAPARGGRMYVNVMTSGIWINGRQWKTDMIATYTNPIARHRRPGLAHVYDPATFCIGQIITFHVYRPAEHEDYVVIARVWKHRVHSTWNGLWIVHSADPEETEYISVDRIVHGLHAVPHWADPERWIGVPWWKSM